MAKNAVSLCRGIGKDRFWQWLCEIAVVKLGKDLIEIICPAFRRRHDLFAARTFARHGLLLKEIRLYICVVKLVRAGRYLFAKQLRDEDVCQAFVAE